MTENVTHNLEFVAHLSLFSKNRLKKLPKPLKLRSKSRHTNKIFGQILAFPMKGSSFLNQRCAMKNQDGTFTLTMSFRCLLTLLVLGLVTLPACQRAKMKPVPRQERPHPGPGSVEPLPEANPQEEELDPNTQPPILLPPADSEGEGEEKGPIVITPPPLRTEPVTSQEFVTQQPALPHTERNIISWLDPNAPVHPSILDQCAWENCEELPPPSRPTEKEARSYTQTSEPITNMLDVLFVMDTSNSLDEERAAIANNMNRFIEKVEQISQRHGYRGQLDYQMAVLLAHGPNTALTGKSGSSAYGNLFVHREESSVTNPVLKSSEMNVNQISQTLLKRFNGNGNLTSIRDRSNTQGEAGLLSLEQFLRSQINASTGFPRANAALMIVFVSDENDVCYDYKAANDYFASIGIERRDAPQVHSSNKKELNGVLRDKPEHEAFAHECGSGNRGQADTIVRLIKNIKGYSEETHNNLPVIPAAVVYRTKGEQEQAQDRHKGSFYGDNEMGHGYLNVAVQFGSSNAISLLEGDFGQKLAHLGKKALFSMNFFDTLPIQTPDGAWLDLRIIPNSSIRVDVEVKVGRYAGQTITLIQNSEYTVQRTQLEPEAAVHGHVLLQRESREGLVWDNAVIRIYYME